MNILWGSYTHTPAVQFASLMLYLGIICCSSHLFPDPIWHDNFLIVCFYILLRDSVISCFEKEALYSLLKCLQSGF